MKWLRSYLAFRGLTIARKRAVKIIKRSQRLNKRLAKRQRQLKHLAETIDEDLDDVLELNKDRDQALEILMNKVEVLEDMLVPELTMAQKMATARWEAELSIQKARQVAARPNPDRDNY